MTEQSPNRVDQSPEPVDQLEVTHCPFCGDQGQPLLAVEGDRDVRVTFECESHGQMEIEVTV